MGEITRVNGIELWWEEFGDRSGPTVLLIMGAYMNSQAWPQGFIASLIEAGFHIVRFDNRDSGKSTWFGEKSSVEKALGVLPRDLLRPILKLVLGNDSQKPEATDSNRIQYDLFDMAEDATGLLDHLEIERAHIVGVSMGGLIAQIIAIEQQHRIKSLNLLITTPGLHEDKLSRTPREFLLSMIDTAILSLKGNTLDAALNIARSYKGSRFYFDEQKVRQRGVELLEHGYNSAALHSKAVDATPSQLSRLASISVPTVVIHGSEDPLIPIDHAQALADNIPNSNLLTMEGVGHELPEELISEISSTVIKNMRSNF